MKARLTPWAALAALVALCAGQGSAQEIDDLPRQTTEFKYYELGRHVPPRSGYADYIGARTIIDNAIGLPMGIRPQDGENMFCNTQVWGFKADGTPGGKSNHIKNYTYPWTPTFCEIRWVDNQPTRACGTKSPQSHQGIDCRPPKPLADTYWMTAVEDGVVRSARRNLVEVVGTKSTILWKYRHGGPPVVKKGDRVTKGANLARITDLGSTPIHLHLEAERPAGRDVDPMAAVIAATLRALGETPRIEDGELVFDPRFEIAADAAPSACDAARMVAPLGADRKATFTSLWCHNGSIMGLADTGGTVMLTYHQPRSDSLARAVRDEPVLLTGRIEGGRFRGSARHYSVACGNHTFAVEGPWAGGSHVLTGRRKQFGPNCSASERSETLSFTLLRPNVPGAPPPDPERKSLTEVTRNWGAITMASGDPDRWLPYVRTWPGLVLGAEMMDSVGGVIPAFQTDEAGIGLWWYWLTVRKGFGETGRPSLLALSRGIAGTEASNATIQRYLTQYTALAALYFARPLGPNDPIDLTLGSERWALGQTMFHHESGRAPLFNDKVFFRGVHFGSDVINGRFRTVDSYSRDDNPRPDEPRDSLQPDLDARITELERRNAELLATVARLSTVVDSVRRAVAQ